jgi:uncharacterized protein YkvS
MFLDELQTTNEATISLNNEMKKLTKKAAKYGAMVQYKQGAQGYAEIVINKMSAIDYLDLIDGYNVSDTKQVRGILVVTIKL